MTAGRGGSLTEGKRLRNKQKPILTSFEKQVTARASHRAVLVSSGSSGLRQRPHLPCTRRPPCMCVA